MWEKQYLQSGATYHVFSHVNRTASWSFHSRLLGMVSYTAQAIALRVWREQIVFVRLSSIVNIKSSCLSESHEWKAFHYPRFFGRRVLKSLENKNEQGKTKRYVKLLLLLLLFKAKVVITETETRWKSIRIEESESDSD